MALNLQLFADIDADEFNPVLRREITPKILITTCRFNSTVSLLFFCTEVTKSVKSTCLLWFLIQVMLLDLQRGPAFISELLSVIPNSHYQKRGTYDLKKVLLLVSEDTCFLIKLVSFCNYITF